jgi:hypothetical protein
MKANKKRIQVYNILSETKEQLPSKSTAGIFLSARQ